jgi:ATP-binding cassette subfamily C protein
MTLFKTPSKIQVEAIECGAVATWIILGYYGKWITTEEARQSVNITKDGSSAYNIAVALRSYGFTSDGFQPSVEDLKSNKPECGLPCIVWINKVHWVVLERFENNQFLISDPAKGHRKASVEDFKKEYSGLAISANPTSDFIKSGRKPNPFLDVLEIVSSYKSSLLSYILLGSFATIPTVALSSYIGFFTDTIISEKFIGNSYVWVLVLLVGSSFLFKYIQTIILRRIHLSLLTTLLERSIVKLISLPLTFYPLRDLGEISQRLTLNINLSNILTGPLASASIGVVSMVIYLIIMLSYNIPLGLAVLILGAINFYALISVASRLGQLSMKSSMMTGKMTSNILYIVNNYSNVKENGLEASLYSQWSDNFSASQENSQTKSLIQKQNLALTSFLNQLADYLIVIFSGILILTGSLSLGEFLSFRLISLAFLRPINTLSGVNTSFSNAIGDVNRLKDLWDAKDSKISDKEFVDTDNLDASKAKSTTFKDLSKFSNDISLKVENLSYRYTPNSDPVFQDISLNLQSGDIVSLTGPPGVGKTTLLNCLSALEASNYDKFEIGDQPVDQYQISALRNLISYSTQSRYIFDGTIAENIAVYNPSITSPQIRKTLKYFDLWDDFSDLPKGLETHISNTSTISNTVKVYIHLARSLVRSPYIIIIDDFLLYLDSEKVQSLLTKISQSSAIVLFVTKDPSLISIANRSLVLSKKGLLELPPSSLYSKLSGAA